VAEIIPALVAIQRRFDSSPEDLSEERGGLPAQQVELNCIALPAFDAKCTVTSQSRFKRQKNPVLPPLPGPTLERS
jgi:hypothetical protein